MKTKIKRWMSMAMACFVLLSCIIPVYADEPQTIDRSAAATLPLEWEQEESEEITPATQQDEEQGEDIPAEVLTQPEGFDPAEAESDTPVSELPPEPEGETAAEKCVAYEHLSDAEGICTVCGTDLIAEFTALYAAVPREEYISKMNAWGWYEQNQLEEKEQAEAEAMALFDIATAAVDVYTCFEGSLADSVPDDLYNKLLDLYAMNEAAQLAYRYPQNPDIFNREEDEPDTEPEDYEGDALTDDILFRDLPDAPTGSCMTSRGLPVPTGNTKISISGWRNDLLGKEYFDVDALNAGSASITVAKEIVMVLTVYGRMFNLYIYTAIAPVPLVTFAGEPTSSAGKSFIRSYASVCLQGVTIALACIIFSVMAADAPAVDTGVSAVTAVWSYVGTLVFNLLILVGAIKGCDRIVREMMGL